MSEDRLPQIPKEWKWVKLEEVGELIKGVSYKKKFASKISKKDYMAILRANNIKNGKINFNDLIYVPVSYVKDEQKIKAGDILIAMSSGSKDLVGKAAQAEQNYDVAFGAFCGLIRFSTRINKKYFGFYFQSKEYKNYISKLSSGININNLRREHIGNINLPFAPLLEQQKIVEILEEAFSKIDIAVAGLKKIKKLLSLYRQSVLKYAFEGKLTQKWREKNKDKIEPAEKLIEKIKKEREERYKQELEEWKKISEIAKKEGKKKPPKPKPPKELPPITEEELKNLPQIPKEWKWVRLGEITEIILGQSPPSSTYNTEGKGLPFFQGSGEFGKIYPTIKKWCTEPKKIAEQGNILISVRAPVGDVNITPDKCAIGRGLASISPIKPLQVKYFFHLLKFSKNKLQRFSTGSTFDAINGDVLRNFIIPLSPLPEQQKIVEEIEYRLSIADKLEETVDKLLKLSEKLKQSYLKYAFEGKLTEEWRKQNSHLISGDNSVDKLLEKIKAEKVKFERQKKEKLKLECRK